MSERFLKFSGVVTLTSDAPYDREALIEHLNNIVIVDMDTETHGVFSEKVQVSAVTIEFSTIKEVGHIGAILDEDEVSELAPFAPALTPGVDYCIDCPKCGEHEYWFTSDEGLAGEVCECGYHFLQSDELRGRPV